MSDPTFDPEKRWCASARPWGRNSDVLVPEVPRRSKESKAVPGGVRPIEPEPGPVIHSGDDGDRYPKIVDLVIKDMTDKAEKGKAKYGTYLQPHNGRDPLIDRYQELLDACQYARQEIYEKYGS